MTFLLLPFGNPITGSLSVTEASDVLTASIPFTISTTLQALQTGSTRYQLVCAIEGYKHLLTDGDPFPVQAAWATSDQLVNGGFILGGLHVELDNAQEIDPWDPLPRGGKLILRITPDGNLNSGISDPDTLGIDMFRKNAGAESILTGSTIGRDDTPITVKSASAFGGSFAYIGVEAFKYTGKTATQFTGCTRGMFSPFAAGGTGAPRFGQRHRIGLDANGVNLSAVVSEQPRVWIGKRVGLWMHTFEDSLTLNTQAEAQCLYAGRIVSIADATNPPHTVIELEHVLDELGEASLGRDMWTGKIKEGIYLRAGNSFTARDNKGGGIADRTANALTVVASGASGANQINQGTYTLAQITTLINVWIASEFNAGRLYGTYSFAIVNTTDGIRTRLNFFISTAVGGFVKFRMLRTMCSFLGWPGVANDTIQVTGINGNSGTEDSPAAPLRFVMRRESSSIDMFRFDVYDEQGTFWDNWAYLPTKPVQNGFEWGVFEINGSITVLAAKSGSTFRYVSFYVQLFSGSNPVLASLADFSVSADDNTTEIEIKQVFMVAGSWGDILKRVLVSTGTTGYNDDTPYDTLGYGLGLALPGSIVDLDSIDTLPSANTDLLLIVHEPIKFGELFAGDFLLRWAYARWVNGKIGFRSWTAPKGTVIASLDENNKAAPQGNQDDHRTTAVTSDQWQKTIVKVEFNRNLLDVTSEDYQKRISFEDQTAVDDAGGVGKLVTIKARNSYDVTGIPGTGGIAGLLGNFLATLPLFSRPLRKLTRSIDLRFFEGYAPGDYVELTDNFARDPDTGMRSIQTRPAMIVSHRYSIGGFTPNASQATGMTGELDLIVLDIDRIEPYAPAAQIDDTQANGGYNVAGKILTCYAHKFSEASETADAVNFPIGTKVRVVQRDAPDPNAPLTWLDTVANQSGNTITLTTGLSTPAWDATKKYIITYDAYSVVGTTERQHTFQADDADALVEDLRAPYQYTTSLADGPGHYTPNTASDPVCIPPAVSYGDGKPLDVAHEIDLIRLYNNLTDFKCPISAPILLNAIASGYQDDSIAAGQWRLVLARPFFLTAETYIPDCFRKLDLSPWFRNNAHYGAEAGSIRVTIADRGPSEDKEIDIDRGANFVDATWTDGGSTTWQTGAVTSINIVKGTGWFTAGVAWLLVEVTRACETRGLARCQEGPRKP